MSTGNNGGRRSQMIVATLLIVSLILYAADYFVFGRATDIASGFLGNLAFLPIYVLFVTLMIERVLKEREREALRQKLNMVIGVFFSEVGTALLGDCFVFVREKEELAAQVKVSGHWSDDDFKRVSHHLAHHPLHLDSRLGDLGSLKQFLMAKRSFMLSLLENPNLLEHDEFTDLLWAVFHLIEELEARKSFDHLPSTDLDHLSGDIKRAYSHLLKEWLVYLRHLKQDYPYLFSLAVRVNPLNPEADPVVGG